ncbi:hypothetical protein [Aeromicrobium sp.]|uniref:hypothetical protein n=1 Tax=Aeromicrobium sp. TaxID=1871063 RepID=UPI0019B9BFA5|nr:hypothetical protein [Aeromicrobium sp.]MBC7633904.1 hypothetical protein [Aeromicrobium sp.]
MNRRPARCLGLLGGASGMIAGVVQAVAGPDIPELTGSKASPVALGLLTIVLSAIGLASAVSLGKDSIPPSGRVASAVGMLVPGVVCFTTVGALWYLPGPLLTVPAGLAVAGGWRESRDVIATAWLPGLVSLLGAFEVMMALRASPLALTLVGVLGGLALFASPWMRNKRPRLALLLVGTIPFAVAAWWSLVVPLLAILALAISGVIARRRRTRPTALDATGRWGGPLAGAADR